MKRQIHCPCCNHRMFDLEDTFIAMIAKLTKSNENTADMVLKCQCKNLISVRFPRNSNPNIRLAKGIEKHELAPN